MECDAANHDAMDQACNTGHMFNEMFRKKLNLFAQTPTASPVSNDYAACLY
jgi:hypothetical protein